MIVNGIMIFTIMAIAATGCKKPEKEDKDTSAATDNEQMEGIGNDVGNIADAAAAGVNGFRVGGGAEVEATMAPCATVTRDTVSVPHTITIDFGSTNCLCYDNRYRRGIIYVSYTGTYFGVGSSRTVTFTDFFVNDKKVEGTHTVSNNGLNAAGNYTWTIVASNMKVTLPNGLFHTWNSNRVREMIAGASTPIIRSDDIYSVTGTADGVNKNGISYTANIIHPIVRALSCNWIQEGKIKVVPVGFEDRLLDFGNGTCDNQATVTIGSVTHNITLQ